MSAGQTVSRRTVAKGAAWSVPVVTMGAMAPALAASQTPTVSGSICSMTYGGASLNDQVHYVYPGVTTSTGVIPVGTTLTWTIRVQGAFQSYVPNKATSSGGEWTMTMNPDSNTGLGSDGTFTVTLRFDKQQTVTADQQYCVGSIAWTDAQYPLRPSATISITSNAPTGPVNSGGMGTLVYQVPQRHSTETSSTRAMRYLSLSGTQKCYPSVRYIFKAGQTAGQGTNGSSCGDARNNSSTIYPDGTCRKVNITSGQADVPQVCP